MTENLVQESGKVWVEAIYTKNRRVVRKKSKNEEIAVEARKLPDGVVCGYVKVGIGQTINLGDFNSVRVDVGVSLPALPNEMQDAYQEALATCQNWLAENVEEILEARE